MLFFDGFFGVLMLGVWVFCIIDVITTDSVLVRHLPKLVWLMIVLLLPEIGSIAWLVAGHPWQQGGTANLPYNGNLGSARNKHLGRADAGSPGAAELGLRNTRRGGVGDLGPTATAAVPSSPDDDEQFLAGLRRRAEEQRRRAREQGDG